MEKEHVIIGIGAGFIAGYIAGYFTKRKPAPAEDVEELNYIIGRKNDMIASLIRGDDVDHDSVERLIEETDRYRSEHIPEVVGTRRRYHDQKPELADLVPEAPPAPEAVIDPDMPRVITEEDFRENEPEHEQTTFTYYAKDDVLVAMNEEEVEDELNIVGTAWRNEFTPQKHETWVRNDELGIDIEIVRQPGSWEGPEHEHSSD
jgi:hypothetical protein